jgi:hypothetical protein
MFKVKKKSNIQFNHEKNYLAMMAKSETMWIYDFFQNIISVSLKKNESAIWNTLKPQKIYCTL